MKTAKIEFPSTIGTPKNLDEAVRHAICIGPMNEIEERSYHVLKDFMAQNFGVAYLQAEGNEVALNILKDLFGRLTKRGSNDLNESL